MDADVVVVGAGVVGVAAARALAFRGRRVVVVEKEPGPAYHQSGRNSGVLHAGYNLKPGSLKARFCVQGNRQARAYCEEKGLPLHSGGVLVVARTEAERSVLAQLRGRAEANGVRSRRVGPEEIREIEPYATGLEALHAPEGASFDPPAFVRALAADAEERGARFMYATRALAPDSPAERRGATSRASVRLKTSRGTLEARCLLNCAGLYADRLAGHAARDLQIVPFRGYYAELKETRRHLVRSHVYAAPDLEFPFLGVHLSRRVDGRVIIGPGAMLAFGRQAYRLSQVNLEELMQTLLWPGFYRLFASRGFRRLLRSEISKSLFLPAIVREAAQLVPEIRSEDLVASYAGNRAQLVSRDGKLVDDLVVREEDRTVHVLNAVSPGLTCSLPFGDYLADLCEARAGG